jgi:hypothetical protein
MVEFTSSTDQSGATAEAGEASAGKQKAAPAPPSSTERRVGTPDLRATMLAAESDIQQ